MALRDWLAWWLWPGIGYRRLAQLLKQDINPTDLFTVSRKQWDKLGLPARLYKHRVYPDDLRVQQVLDWAAIDNRYLLSWEDELYPPLLREIADPPLVLCAIGDISLLQLEQIAIVGSRKATPLGLETTRHIAAQLAAQGVVITSGLAIGIDTAAHLGAISVEGHTVAVLANGLANIYPLSNRLLAEKIANCGLLISEQPPWVQPKPYLFPLRNRLISGLSLGVLVVQAGLRSGSLITARMALEQNREVMAVPGEAQTPWVQGCHQLLRQGAALVESAADVLQIFPVLASGPACPQQPPTAIETDLEATDTKLLHCIGDAPTTIDQLGSRMALSADKLYNRLLNLELQGFIKKTVMGYQRIVRWKRSKTS